MCVILSDTCRTSCSRCLLLRPLTVCTWSRPIPAEQHAHAIFSFACLQFVRDLVRYLQNIMLMPSSPSPAYSPYVISSDSRRIACSRRLLCPRTESTWSRPMPAEQHADAAFSFPRLQNVRDLIRYLQNSMLMPSSPSPTYRMYVISSLYLCSWVLWATSGTKETSIEAHCGHLRFILWMNTHTVPCLHLRCFPASCRCHSHHPACSWGHTCECPRVTRYTHIFTHRSCRVWLKLTYKYISGT